MNTLSFNTRCFLVFTAIAAGTAALIFSKNEKNLTSDSAQQEAVAVPAPQTVFAEELVDSSISERTPEEAKTTSSPADQTYDIPETLDISTAADAFEQAVKDNPNALSQGDMKVVSELLSNLRYHASYEQEDR